MQERIFKFRSLLSIARRLCATATCSSASFSVKSLLVLNTRIMLLTAPRSPTIRFPPATPLDATFDKFPSYTLPIQKRDFDSKKDKWFTKELYFEFKDLFRPLGADDWLVLKTCAKLLSGGWTDENQLTNFLQICSELPNDNNLKQLIVEKLFLGVYAVQGKASIRFALTRYLPCLKCLSQEFAHW